MERFIEFAMNHWILSSTFAALVVALIATESRRGGRKLSPQQLVALINRDEAVLLDVRDRKEYSEGRITGSIHMPLSTITERASELKKHQGKQIVVVDRMGQHSGMAVKQLTAAGFPGAVRLAGGIMDWKAANLPLVKK